MQNLVVLTGDTHNSLAAELRRDPADPIGYTPIGVEFGAPGSSSPNMYSPSTPQAANDAFAAQFKAQNPWYRYAEYRHKGFISLDITHERIQAVGSTSRRPT